MRLSIKITILLLVVIIFSSLYFLTEKKSTNSLCKGNKKCFTATMKEISDGDSFRVDDQKVRLALVNAPEKGEVGYEKGKSFVESICPIGSKVLVDQDDLQPYSYDRMVAVIYCNGKNLNAELLRNNLAVIDKRFCLKSEFGNEEWAKEHGC